MFKITRNKGFHITFENGWTVSVQFGAGNYCENYSMSFSDTSPKKSPDAEIAAWDADGNWHQFEEDDVKGSCSPAEVLAFMNMIAAK